MAALKLWRLTFMTKSVMGFLASSLNLASGSAHVGDARHADREQDAGSASRDARGQKALAQPTRDTARSAMLPERRGPERRSQVLNIAGPATWRRRHSSASNITEFMRTLRTGIASFVVPPPVDFTGTAEAFQRGMVRRVSESMPVVEGTTRTGSSGAFRFVSFVMKPPWGAPRRIVLYTALWSGKGQVLLFGADCDQMFEDNVLVAHTLVQRIVVPSI